VAALSIVVIPARDEAERVDGCLAALAAQTVGRDRFEIIVVADACRDDTAERARCTAMRLGLRLEILPGPGAGVGAARRLGMDAAASRLAALGALDALIACTDADSRPAPDWLERQLHHVRARAAVIAGTIELDPDEAAGLPAGARERRERDAARRLHAVRSHDATAEHHHFAGASIGITARAYLDVGGIEPLPALEDAAFATRLLAHGVAIRRPGDVRVRTSARVDGRTGRGLSVDLAVSSWLERRRYRAELFPVDALARIAPRPSVSVIIPAKECAATIAAVVELTAMPLVDAGVVDELVVVDAASIDGTAERAAAAGATVLQQDELLPAHGPALGKGDAMWRALAATTGELVCFLDGDTLDPDPRHLQGLIGPLLTDPSLALVKGAFDRPLRTGAMELPHEGGRVTELMARPLLNLHHPLLAGFTQPLAGEFAATRAVLAGLPFPVGYGIEIALLIDALGAAGLDALAECALGVRRNRHQPLRELGAMAYAVLAAAERRVPPRPRSPLGGHFLRPWGDAVTSIVPIEERPPLVTLGGADPVAALGGAA
jgi:glycosyltransferase involved in cell wall biosynthesis